jgi:hypothetical protein
MHCGVSHKNFISGIFGVLTLFLRNPLTNEELPDITFPPAEMLMKMGI